MDMNLSKLHKMVRDRESWHATVSGVVKSWIQLGNWTIIIWDMYVSLTRLQLSWGQDWVFLCTLYSTEITGLSSISDNVPETVDTKVNFLIWMVKYTWPVITIQHDKCFNKSVCTGSQHPSVYGSTHMSIPISQFIPPLPCVHTSAYSLHLCCYCCLRTGSSVPFF